ncbi:MAG: nucleoside deaminase [Candidatus Levybacteria bacterium]|nr:nucleoside deaminase [Candidatus Levybacteria bacterium]MBP9814902.1 nucleoside deaminase [Candidatus Levybacteria bacterium]
MTHEIPLTSDFSLTISRFRQETEKMKEEAKSYSAQEYLALANEQALIANSEGNYGVGAIYVYRVNGTEYVIGGRNGILSRKNTVLHAEQDTINAVESLARGEDTYKDRVLKIRQAPHEMEEKKLFTSLEPCIMCTGRILTHKPDEVFIGTADDFAGAMLDGREKGLPLLWQGMRNGDFHAPDEKPSPLKVTVATTIPGSESYIPEKYLNLGLNIFLSTREEIDSKMGKNGLSPNLSTIPENITRLTR